MSVALAILVASFAPADSPATSTLGCNAIAADGEPSYFELQLNRETSTVRLIREGSELPAAESKAQFGEFSSVTFTVSFESKPLQFHLWNGFSRKQSLIDGSDTSSLSASFRLPYLVGICASPEKIKHVEHAPLPAKDHTGQGLARGECFGVDLRGNIFNFYFKNVGGDLFLNLNGGGYLGYSDRLLTKRKFPSLPEDDLIFRNLTGYETRDGGEPVSFILEFTVNKNSMINSNIVDFQILGSDNAPLMVARGHCGFNLTTTR